VARQAQGFTIPLEFIALINSSQTRHAMEPNHSEISFPLQKDLPNFVANNRSYSGY
jgi:hypothetical protein